MSFIDRLRQQKVTSTLLVLGTLSVGILIGTVWNAEWGHASAQSAATDATPLTVPPIVNIGNEFSALARKGHRYPCLACRSDNRLGVLMRDDAI